MRTGDLLYAFTCHLVCVKGIIKSDLAVVEEMCITGVFLASSDDDNDVENKVTEERSVSYRVAVCA
jgi:hypothetical protein